MKRLIGLAVLAASAAFAQDKAAAPPAGGMPKPPAEMSAEQWFVGTWTCAGQRHAGPMGPEMKTATKLEFKMELAGFWLQIKGTAAAGPMKGKEIFEGFAGYDGSVHQRYTFHPDALVHLTSKGWDGDKLVSDGERTSGGQKMSFRHTITKKGDNQFDSAAELDGKPTIEETCTRAAAKK